MPEAITCPVSASVRSYPVEFKHEKVMLPLDVLLPSSVSLATDAGAGKHSVPSQDVPETQLVVNVALVSLVPLSFKSRVYAAT